ncbi:hypothetical protein GCM10023321_31800 [Pseudonocardia eucalypti]|uniref:Uncharacterized protein n=1 Tax=Pseudonocardia eucalypti TaxID=648755 RepID=A0ABP9Q3F4_9PSEU
MLRRAGCRDWSERDEAAGGFVVTAASGREVFFVDCEQDPPQLIDEMRRYAPPASVSCPILRMTPH